MFLFFYIQFCVIINAMEKNLNKKIKVALKKIEDLFNLDSSGHDLGHLIRTMLTAEKIQKAEGGDLEIILLSAVLHDLHRIMENKEGRYVSPEESLPAVRSILDELNVDSEKKERILYSILHHEEYGFGKEKIEVKDIESKILQDADNLDAIGAVGLLRCFKFCQAHKITDYLDEPLYYEEFSESKHDISLIHHLHNKLCRLKDYMNTPTASKIAKRKTKILEDFVKGYIEEIKDEYLFKKML